MATAPEGTIAPVPIPPPSERYDRQNEAAFRNAMERLLKKLLNIPSRTEATTIVNNTVTDITIVGQAVRRSTVTLTTPLMAPGSYEEGTLALGGDTDLVKIVSDQAGWLRLYRTAADRTADAARAITDDPTTPVAAEFIFTDPSYLDIDLAPVPHTVTAGATSDALVYWRFDLTGSPPAGTIADDFSTAPGGTLVSYTPPGGAGYTAWETIINGASGNDLHVSTAGITGYLTSGADRVGMIDPNYADHDFVGLMKIHRQTGTLYFTCVAFAIDMPDSTVTDDYGIYAGIFGGTYPSGGTLTPQIIENQTVGGHTDGRVVLASGSPVSITAGSDYYLKLTVSVDGLTLTLEGSATSISGPWTTLCSTVLTGTLPGDYVDGVHTAVGVDSATADFSGTEWLVKYLSYSATPASVTTHIDLTRVLIEGATP